MKKNNKKIGAVIVKVVIFLDILCFNLSHILDYLLCKKCMFFYVMFCSFMLCSFSHYMVLRSKLNSYIVFLSGRDNWV